MKKIRIPLKHFDTDAFLNQIIEFLKTQVAPEIDPTFVMARVEAPGQVPVYGPETGWDVLDGLERGDMVFFPFARSSAEGLVTCANGNSYGPSDHEDDEDFERRVVLGDADSLGYLVQIQDGEVVVASAIDSAGGCVGPPPSVDLVEDCGLLEEPITLFIESFIK